MNPDRVYDLMQEVYDDFRQTKCPAAASEAHEIASILFRWLQDGGRPPRSYDRESTLRYVRYIQGHTAGR